VQLRDASVLPSSDKSDTTGLQGSLKSNMPLFAPEIVDASLFGFEHSVLGRFIMVGVAHREFGIDAEVAIDDSFRFAGLVATFLDQRFRFGINIGVFWELSDENSVFACLDTLK
jgi:hypothetical protein